MADFGAELGPSEYTYQRRSRLEQRVHGGSRSLKVVEEPGCEMLRREEELERVDGDMERSG